MARASVGTCLGEANATLAGVRSPPLHGRRAQDAWPNGGNPQITRRWFSRRDALCASAWQGCTDAEAFHSDPMSRRTGRGPAGIGRGQARAFLPGVRSPPSAGLVIRARMASRGKTRGRCGGRFFLGGARSPRPRGNAVLMPRHNIIIGGKRTPGGQMGTCPESSRSVPHGRAEPAPPGGQSKAEMA